jgi:hypothetical protein
VDKALREAGFVAFKQKGQKRGRFYFFSFEKKK